jgi:hypothetical protein
MSSMSSTRLILNGRVYTYGDREVPYSTEQLEAPLGYINPPQNDYVDGPWKLRYRLMDKANPPQDWLTMPEMLELTRQQETWIAMKVVEGAVDAAMVRGSGIPLFRIRNRTEIVHALITTPAATGVKKVENKNRWDK